MDDQNQTQSGSGNQQIDEKVQKELNTPLADDSGLSQENSTFLDMLMGMISDGKIDLYKPETLVNKDVYEKLSEEIQGKIDMEAMNLLAVIRDIKGLYDADFKETFQMQNLVERIRLTKERIEVKEGDVFII